MLGHRDGGIQERDPYERQDERAETVGFRPDGEAHEDEGDRSEGDRGRDRLARTNLDQQVLPGENNDVGHEAHVASASVGAG